LNAPREAAGALGVDYFSPSVRMGLQTAVALESAALLQSAHVDACLRPGRASRALGQVAGPRVANRVVQGIPAGRIHNHPQLAIVGRLRRHLILAGRDTTAMEFVLRRIFSAIARQCSSEAVIGTQNACLELFEGREYRIMEQVSTPHRYERAVTAAELARFPGWATDTASRSRPWDLRMEAEWQAADLILVPSRRLIAISREYGADPRKFHVLPYPISRPQPPGRVREPRFRRKLHVVFAGTLMLQKGVQYVYQALRKRPDLPVHMEFFGSVNLTPLGMSRLAEVGTVHGPVPRSELLDAFRHADILLFPSLAEGSALVTLEAASLGLPVVATEEAGAPMGAMVIPSRSAEGIIEAIEAIADDPAQLEKLSAACLAEAAKRTTDMYSDSIADSIRQLLRYQDA
jgi:hypothetical protein